MRKIVLTKKAVKRRVKKKGSAKSRFIIGRICDIINLDMVKVVSKKMNRVFIHENGHPAYDRRMLIGGELFCREKKISSYAGVEREFEDNATLEAFAGFKTPKYTVISTFMKELSEVWIKQIFTDIWCW